MLISEIRRTNCFKEITRERTKFEFCDLALYDFSSRHLYLLLTPTFVTSASITMLGGTRYAVAVQYSYRARPDNQVCSHIRERAPACSFLSKRN
jgi:hypothetical protein